MVGKNLMFFQNNTRSKFTIAKIKLCSFTNLISQTFSDTAVILPIAVSKRCTQDLPVVKRQGSSTGFLFTYHSAIPEKFFQRKLFHWNSWLWVPFSINFLSSSAFLGFRKALKQDAMSSTVSATTIAVPAESHTRYIRCYWEPFPPFSLISWQKRKIRKGITIYTIMPIWFYLGNTQFITCMLDLDVGNIFIPRGRLLI